MFTAEEILKKDHILVVSSHPALSGPFQKLLSHYPCTSEQTARLPTNLDAFSIIFLVNLVPSDKQWHQLTEAGTRICAVFIGDKAGFTKVKKRLATSKLKLVFINTLPNTATFEKIMWFALSSSLEPILQIDRLARRDDNLGSVNKLKKLPLSQRLRAKRKKVVATILMLFVCFLFAFAIPLLMSFAVMAQVANARGNTARLIGFAKPLVWTTQKSYALSRPFLSFFYLAPFPDAFVELQRLSLAFLQTSDSTKQNGTIVTQLILKKNKTKSEKITLLLRLKTLSEQTARLSDLSYQLNQNTKSLPQGVADQINTRLAPLNQSLEAGKKLVTFLPDLLAQNGERTYLLFFYNNMEIRPGGGFLGSFAKVRFADLTMQEFVVYDVYDADGQLKEHVEPPQAIRDYLNQPNFFLRDSNFSPLFPANVKTAEGFLEKELGIGKVDGAVGITATGMTYLLDAFGPVHLADTGETITADNFILKTQVAVEKDFFPGSTKKKNTLSSLARQLVDNLPRADAKKLALAVIQGAQEKQMVFYFSKSAQEQVFQELGFAGTLNLPQCRRGQTDCVANSIVPIDANFGFNKANLFISKKIKFETNITDEGVIENIVQFFWINSSPGNIYPAGDYKNYFQLYLPLGVSIDKIMLDKEKVEDWQQQNTDEFKVISLLFTVPSQNSRTLSVSYHFINKLTTNSTYQLLIQKQIGSAASDFSFRLTLPQSLTATNANFALLEKNRKVAYNTHLTQDKLFIIELKKTKP